METIAYTKGLHEIGDGLHAYLQPDGGWGWSNAGLISGDGDSLLVDTLFDIPLTEQMLSTMEPMLADAPLSRAINTHGDGDHWFGNAALPAGTRIHATERARERMGELTPEIVGSMLAADLGEDLNALASDLFGAFDLSGGESRFPDETFSGSESFDVDGRNVEVIEFGPAHTVGDAIIHVPDASVVFTGDLLFVNCTPVVRAGLSNWIEACETIKDLGASTLVPGHGPVTGNDGLDDLGRYLEHIKAQCAERHGAGMTVDEAIDDVEISEFRDWGAPERVVINVHAAWQELDPEHESKPEILLIAEAQAYARRHGL